MELYDDWTREECLSAIREIQVNLKRGISSVSQPTQGGITYRSLDEAEYIIKLLKAQVNRLDGLKVKNRVIKKVMFGVRPW